MPTKTETQLPPRADSRDFFAAAEKKCVILHYEREGPNLMQTMEIASILKIEKSAEGKLLTVDSKELRENKDMNGAFCKALGVGEWCFVLGPGAVGSLVPVLLHGEYGCVIYFKKPDDAASAVILELVDKKTDPKSFARTESPRIAEVGAAEQVAIPAQREQ